jgi:hypothetical protein
MGDLPMFEHAEFDKICGSAREQRAPDNTNKRRKFPSKGLDFSTVRSCGTWEFATKPRAAA